MTEKRIFRFLNKVMEKGLQLLFAVLILVGVYLVIDTCYVYQQASNDTVRRYKPEEISEETLKEISGSTVAWITIDDTTVDYPVMQADDNLEYLNKDPQGNYSLSGSIFLDCRNQADFSDAYNILYGHHMTEGLMFGALDAYADEEYFLTHRSGMLYCGDREIPFQIVAFLVTKADSREIFSINEMTEYDDCFRKEAVYYIPEDMTGHLLALTTCRDSAATDRTVLVAALSA